MSQVLAAQNKFEDLWTWIDSLPPVPKKLALQFWDWTGRPKMEVDMMLVKIFDECNDFSEAIQLVKTLKFKSSEAYKWRFYIAGMNRAAKIKISTNSLTVQWVSNDITYEQGGVL